MARRGRKRSPFKLRIRIETVHSLGALAFFVLGGITIFSFSGQGSILQGVNDSLRHLFGPAALLVPFLFFSAGLVLTGAKWSFAKPQVFLGSVLLLISFTTLGEMGTFGTDLFRNVSSLILPLGTYLLFSTLAVASVLIFTDTSIREIFHWFSSIIAVDSSSIRQDKEKQLLKLPFGQSKQLEESELKIRGGQQNMQNQQNQIKGKEAIASVSSQSSIPGLKTHQFKQEDASGIGNKLLVNQSPSTQVWQYPSLSLLDPKPRGHADRGDVKWSAGTIESTLDSFGIQAKVR